MEETNLNRIFGGHLSENSSSEEESVLDKLAKPVCAIAAIAITAITVLAKAAAIKD